MSLRLTLNMEGSVNAEHWKLGFIPVNLYRKQDQMILFMLSLLSLHPVENAVL